MVKDSVYKNTMRHTMHVYRITQRLFEGVFGYTLTCGGQLTDIWTFYVVFYPP